MLAELGGGTGGKFKTRHSAAALISPQESVLRTQEEGGLALTRSAKRGLRTVGIGGLDSGESGDWRMGSGESCSWDHVD
ncbi:hypothetical protein SARC_10213 [Sphaeroforma arctica JP610]|uniref:Uncharacterized protein n=1 Tax=Sphaeroforma arctica JP610 TaxID=667725 RepID=A0A0L0FKM9_9EUKA|nr:hypothetical protein SARC_10213 [Sphaeroforma arctica JP610]KNC77325.1 hypothetical protein SARC_10213 [Sphaeroforma arctica JP610]|eukprot:XP_014151227.1 hypothetical protein SARC_10213 [Sphaeroforma arctica JP610]